MFEEIASFNSAKCWDLSLHLEEKAYLITFPALCQVSYLH